MQTSARERQRHGVQRRHAEHRQGERRPDRLAMWAVVLSVVLMVVAAASAHAASGGVGFDTGGPTAVTSGEAPAVTSQFGSRVLRVGMEGEDVRILNGIVRSKRYASAVRVGWVFENPTAGAVKKFQGAAGLPTTGMVDKWTSKALTSSMDRAGATWYGPGFYGNRTACGAILRRATVGVAHRSLPCGTKVTFAYHGRHLVAPVIDRGPYAGGYKFDLTAAAADELGFSGSGTLRYAIAKRGSDRRGL